MNGRTDDLRTAVILCGGQGTRMGSLTEDTPKSLLEVQGRPILWYIVTRLYLSGVRRFVLPVGYLGTRIAAYVDNVLRMPDTEILCVDTGVDTPISRRIDLIRGQLPEDGSFLLTNGDAIFDFDIVDMADCHQKSEAAITFATVPTVSKYGLVMIENGHVTGFERQSRVAAYLVEQGERLNSGFVYAGTCMLHRRALDVIDLAASRRFEAELFPKLIAADSARSYPLNGFWYSIDTPKDLAAVNSGTGSDPIFFAPATALRERLKAGVADRAPGRVL